MHFNTMKVAQDVRDTHSCTDVLLFEPDQCEPVTTIDRPSAGMPGIYCQPGLNELINLKPILTVTVGQLVTTMMITQ